jgi:molybdopterin synthase catalytic subunit
MDSTTQAQAQFNLRLVDAALDVDAAVQAVTHPDAGGIDVFLGTTRAENDPERGALVALEYHAYPEMALAEMHKLAQAAAGRWPIVRAALWHRVGTVAVGQPSVIIAVSCPHRGEAFDACRFLINELKKSVPLWKKELYTHEARWQPDGGSVTHP